MNNYFFLIWVIKFADGSQSISILLFALREHALKSVNSTVDIHFCLLSNVIDIINIVKYFLNSIADSVKCPI